MNFIKELIGAWVLAAFQLLYQAQKFPFGAACAMQERRWSPDPHKTLSLPPSHPPNFEQLGVFTLKQEFMIFK